MYMAFGCKAQRERGRPHENSKSGYVDTFKCRVWSCQHEKNALAEWELHHVWIKDLRTYLRTYYMYSTEFTWWWSKNPVHKVICIGLPKSPQFWSLLFSLQSTRLCKRPMLVSLSPLNTVSHTSSPSLAGLAHRGSWANWSFWRGCPVSLRSLSCSDPNDPSPSPAVA